MIRRRIIIGLTAALSVLGLAGTAPAAAAPATTITYPVSASATRLNGYAFDTCEAPTVSAMQAWASSPYDGIGVYIGGPNRTCAQLNLTASWVSAVSVLRWRVVPIFMGHQAPCTYRPRAREFTATGAATVGTSDASEAVLKAKRLGMLPGSAIYGDMEHYVATDSTCRTAVLRYLSSWTKELHRQGYLSGVYANLNSGAKHLSEAYASTSYARPDALWVARWDHSPTLTGLAGISDTKWSNHQRGKQYIGDHNETYGGLTMNIDSDRFDAPVATVAYTYQATSSTVLNGRSGPSTSYAITKTYPTGSNIKVVCQTPGSAVGSTSVWNKLTDGNYVTDYYVNTPSATTYSAPLPRCTYPYQVTASTLSERTGPGSTFTAIRTMYSGALAWVYCQQPGSKVGTTSVWDRLQYNYYVTDYYVATPSKTTYSKPIPRC